MTLKKIVSVLMVVLLAVSVMAGCEGRNYVVDKYDENPEIETLSSQVVAENERLILEYNDEFKGILLTNKASGKVWSNLEFDENNQPIATSTLNLSLQDMNKYQSVQKYGINPYKEGKISAKKVDNGVELTYYFDDVKISVPVQYTLSSDSMKISIDASKIKEGHPLYRLIYATPSPRLSAVNVTKVEDSYVFTPYGNGTIVSTEINVDGERRRDGGPSNFASHDTSSSRDINETALMPVYGIKADNDALFCIAEKTPSSMGVTFSAGDTRSDYAIVYPCLYLADYDYYKARAKNTDSVRHVSARTSDVVSIGCYPLEGEDADISGMAKCYRNYLDKNGFITESEIEKSPYSLTVMGGVMSTSSVMGIPVSTLKTLTTVAETEKIIGDVTETVGQKPIVVLKGYGENGVNVGKVAGGFKIASEIGTNKEFKALLKYASDNKYSLFTNFEMLKYSTSGGGFSFSKDSTKTAVSYPAEKFTKSIPLRQYNDNPCHILSRNKTGEAIDKLINFTDKIGISNISFSTLGSVTYSDYYDKKNPYAIAKDTDVEFREYVEKLKKSGKTVAGNASAYYSSGLLDAVFDTDLEGDGSHQFEHQVPFYQMVFSGATPMYTEPINLEPQPEKTIMQAATVGMGLGFMVAEDFDPSYMETNAEKLYGCVYGSVKERIKKYVKDYSEVYAQIGGVKVEKYEILENGVTVSTFANGKVVYANQTANTVETEVGTLGAYEFKLGGVE